MDFVKVVWEQLGSKPLLRKNRVIKVIACVLILLALFCSYWDVIRLLGIPLPPRFSAPVVAFLKARLYSYFAMWFILDRLVSALVIRFIYHLVDDDHQKSDIMLRWHYMVGVIDFLFSGYVLLYSVMCLLEYENGAPMDNPIIIYVACIYLIYCFLRKTYHEYKITWDKWNREFTGFVDDNGEEIYVGARVAYNRKKYRVITAVIEKEKRYMLSSYPYRWNAADDDILLDKATNDMNAHFLILK